MTSPNFATHATPKKTLRLFKRPGSVGVISPAYGLEKVSYGLQPLGYTYNKVQRLPLHRIFPYSSFLQNTPLVYDAGVTLVHSFNEIPIGSCPFIVSFENELPRYLGDHAKWQMALGIKILASNRCRGIFAISEIAANNLKRDLAAIGDRSVCAKVGVFRGGIARQQCIEKRQYRSSRSNRELKLLFVGRDAFGKGLIPTLNAVNLSRQEGINVRLTVVCSFEDRPYISKGIFDLAKTRRDLEAMNDFVDYYSYLPNAAVRELMASHDVFLFPTLDESLGWVAIEAAMSGMPIVASRIFAIPELVLDGKTGFLIPIDVSQNQRWVGLFESGEAHRNAVNTAFDCLQNGLVDSILRFWSNGQIVEEFGRSGINHVQTLYDPQQAAIKLAVLYADALT